MVCIFHVELIIDVGVSSIVSGIKLGVLKPSLKGITNTKRVNNGVLGFGLLFNGL